MRALKNNFVLIILSIIIIGCVNKVSHRDCYIPLYYQFPINKIEDGKSIYFEKISFNTGIDVKLNFIIKENEKYLIKASYNHVTNELIDSTKLSLCGKKIEIYTNFLIENIDFIKLKGKIIKDEIIDDGSKYGVRKLDYEFKSKTRKVSINEEEKYLYDTIINNNGSLLKCFVTKTIRNIKCYNKNINFSKEVVNEISYYVKGRGLYIMKTETKDNTYEFIQQSIKDNNGEYFRFED